MSKNHQFGMHFKYAVNKVNRLWSMTERERPGVVLSILVCEAEKMKSLVIQS